MYKDICYANADGTIIRAVRDDDTILVAEPSSGDIWGVLLSENYGPVRAYVPPMPPTAAELLEAERAAMKCSMAQLGLALEDAGELASFEVAVALDTRANIAWRKAATTRRNGILLPVLQSLHTDVEIDDLYRAAMVITD